MNKYIKTDIENGITQLKVGLFNALHEVIRKNVNSIEFKQHIPYSLLLECLKTLNLSFELTPEFIITPSLIIYYNISEGSIKIESK